MPASRMTGAPRSRHGDRCQPPAPRPHGRTTSPAGQPVRGRSFRLPNGWPAGAAGAMPRNLNAAAVLTWKQAALAQVLQPTALPRPGVPGLSLAAAAAGITSDRPRSSEGRGLTGLRQPSVAVDNPASAACAGADGVRQPTIAGASCISSSFSRAAAMNRAKSTRRVRLPARMGSPTCRPHTGRPWPGPSSSSLPRTTVHRVSLANTRRQASTWSSRSTARASLPSRPRTATFHLSLHE